MTEFYEALKKAVETAPDDETRQDLAALWWRLTGRPFERETQA